MAKLDDFLSKKKEVVPILDLSKSIATNKEEFRRLFEKVPDFKIKAEKIQIESIKIKDKKKFKFKSGKKDWANMREPYAFQDPLPNEMQKLKVSDLASISIDWKMLTTLRPKSKMEENYFSRIIELKKFEYKTREYEKRQYLIEPQIRKTKNKSGIVEMRVLSCSECGEDFCNGKNCCKFGYDPFLRVPEVLKESKKSDETSEKAKKTKKKRSRSTSKKIKRKPSKSKSKSPKKISDNKPKKKS